MNQEQNNLNENNFNMQGNNGIPNSQPLNNQNFNNTFNQNVGQSASVNQSESNYQQPLNQMNMQQPTPSFQQPVIQNNQTQSVNSFEGVNTNNQNFNSKPPKKMNLGLIIVIISIVIVVTIILGIALFYNNGENKIENGNSDNIFQKNNDIKQLSVSQYDVVALTNEGHLYYIGEPESMFYDVEDLTYKKTTKIATNVEKFYNGDNAIYYIDKQQDLYYIGSSYSGGSSKPKKDYSEVKDIVAYSNFCGFAIKNNNELYVQNNNFSISYCGLDTKFDYDEFTKVADDVKESFAEGYIGGYINNNDELYISTSNSDFKKILDNVNSVSTYGFTTLFILTNDNKLYVYDDKSWDGVENYELNLLKEDIIELGENYFKTISGEYNVFSSRSDLGLIKDDSKILYEGSGKFYYGVLDVVDIKEILYYINELYGITHASEYDYNEQKKLVYVSTNNKIKLLDKNGSKELFYNTDSLNEIFEFVNKENLIMRQ